MGYCLAEFEAAFPSFTRLSLVVRFRDSEFWNSSTEHVPLMEPVVSRRMPDATAMAGCFGMERFVNAAPPACKKCGRDMARVGKLPSIGTRPLLHVYKCAECRQIVTVRPE
jgi:hypothetical protein